MPEVNMPRLSDTMKEGVLSRWIKNEGDQVREGDVIAEIDTDKATMDLEAFDEGVLEKHLVEEGATVPIGGPVAIIGTGAGTGSGKDTPAKDAEAPATTPVSPAPDTEPHKEPATDRQPASAPETQRPNADAPSGRPLSSPLARRIAKEHGIDPAGIIGTGPGGRIVRADVESAVTAQSQEPVPRRDRAAGAPDAATGASEAESREIPLTMMRKVMAQRLTESAGAPHFFLTNVVSVDRFFALRAEINERFAESGAKVSVTDMLIKACALTLQDHPQVNSSWAGDKILQHPRAHIGVAVALDDGLIVPVVRDAATKGLEVIAGESRSLAQKARNNKLVPAEFSGGTFTLSNLGMFGIDNFTAVINPPEAAILAVGATTEEPYVREGQLLTRQVMKITLTADHRVLDGAVAAAFMRDLKRTLEEPLRIII
ncbi:dihydrolipoamide acetyltransferase family protein [Paeniglutamicibacter antarcticus]|uniref:Dihydrolipoamide acetyltransferase component of pyruvate dehydrogenase complex n=1 Tax=Paeniglutamicibacter antarcticus TaxID=494023 RepID=A0ABP9TPH3_9MICC